MADSRWIDSSRAAASHQNETRPPWRRRSAILALAAAVAAAVWLVRDPGDATIDSLGVTVRPFNNLPGDQRDVAMSPKGDLIAYRQHGEKASEVWLADTKTTRPEKLTEEKDDLQLPVRSQGFNADGSEVWLAGGVDRRLRRVRACRRPEAPRFSWGHWPLTSPGHRRATESSITLAKQGDPIYVADADGENGRVIARAEEDVHQHYQAWSPDERWIYFVRGVQATYQWDLYRVAVDNKGGEPERLTNHDSEVGYPTPIDLRTILYVAKDQDGSGPWLWALDVEQKRPRRIIEGGLDRYTSLAASAGASTLVATAARPTASLWSVPILDRLVEEKDVKPFPLPSDKAPPPITRALMPRFGREALFFLSSRGEGDGLWRVGLRSNTHQDGEPVEMWNGAKGALHVPPAISSDGRSVIVRRIDGKLRLHVISRDGAAHPLTDKVDARGTASWSPDDKWVVTGGFDVDGNEGLFKVPVGGGEPTPIVPGTALNPVWSPIGRHDSLFRQEHRPTGGFVRRATRRYAYQAA